MRVVISVLLFGYSLVCFCQISTDRPTQSFSPYIQPKGTVNLETGFLSERPFRNANLYNVTYINALVRVGVIDWLEMRLTENYLGERVGGASINGWSPLTVGTKIHINDQTENGFPQMGLLASVTLTGNDENFGSEETVQDVRLLMQEDISDHVTLAFNIGTYWSESTQTTGLYSLMLGIGLSDELGIFLEPYGFFAKDTPGDQRFNAGLTYLVSDKVQFDASVGNGLTRKAPDYFLAFGVSVML